MKLLLLILCLSYSTVQAWDDDWEYDYTDEIALQGDARFLNVSFDGIFNNSLLTLAGIFIVGVIMFGKLDKNLAQKVEKFDDFFWQKNFAKAQKM